MIGVGVNSQTGAAHLLARTSALVFGAPASVSSGAIGIVLLMVLSAVAILACVLMAREAE